MIALNHLRAGIGKQKSAAFYFCQCFGIQSLIALNGIMPCVHALRVGRWIENDQIKFSVRHFFQIIQRVLSNAWILLRIEIIQCNILPAKLHRFFRTVDCYNLLRTACQRVNRESAGIAEHVQHFASFRKFFHHLAVLALINKESGLLTFAPVNEKFISVFNNFMRKCRLSAEQQLRPVFFDAFAFRNNGFHFTFAGLCQRGCQTIGHAFHTG